MIQLRRGEERGQTRVDWLDSWHTFSFGDYYDPEHVSWQGLRVLNEDVIAPGGGFPMHFHRDMEIITYVRSGALAHRDSLGGGEVIRAGDVQRMTAGTGIRHSEFNALPTEAVHLFQVWLLPERRGLTPGYEQRAVPLAEAPGQLQLLVSHDGRDGSLSIHHDVALYATHLEASQRLSWSLRPERAAWVQVIAGTLTLNDQLLRAGDGAAIVEEAALDFVAREPAEVLLFDLARVS